VSLLVPATPNYLQDLNMTSLCAFVDPRPINKSNTKSTNTSTKKKGKKETPIWEVAGDISKNRSLLSSHPTPRLFPHPCFSPFSFPAPFTPLIAGCPRGHRYCAPEFNSFVQAIAGDMIGLVCAGLFAMNLLLVR
jgi:hypothetical protein